MTATMTKSELNRFREILEARLIELERIALRREGIAIEKHADEFERLQRAAEREVAARTLETQSARLAETRSALRRIEQNTFGLCLECEEPISARRLAALPWAELCIHCQEARDGNCRTVVQRSPLALAA